MITGPNLGSLMVETFYLVPKYSGLGEYLTSHQAGHTKYNIPFSLKGVPSVNRFFGRDAELLQLKDHFHPMTPCSAPRLNVFAVYGLGGMGKTQLAVEYARRNHNRYSALFWLDGSTEDQLKQSFIGIAHRLPQDQMTVDAAEALSI